MNLQVGQKFVTTKRLIADFISKPASTFGNPKYGTFTMQVYDAVTVPKGTIAVFVGVSGDVEPELWDLTLPNGKKIRQAHLRNWRWKGVLVEHGGSPRSLFRRNLLPLCFAS